MRKLFIILLLFVVSKTFSQGANFDLGTGSGTFTLNSMTGHSRGDTANIVAGTYTGGTINNLFGIYVRPKNAGTVILTGPLQFFSDSGVYFGGTASDSITFSHTSTDAINNVTSTVGQGLVDCEFRYIKFLHINGACWNYSGTMRYVQGTNSTYHWLRVTIHDVYEDSSIRMIQGAFGNMGDPSGPPDVCRQLNWYNWISEASLATGGGSGRGCEYFGICLHCSVHDFRQTMSNGEGPEGDVGVVTWEGWGKVYNGYKNGGPGYDFRSDGILQEDTDPGRDTVYNLIKANSSGYGVVNVQWDTTFSVAGKWHGTGGEFYGLTIANDVECCGYWAPVIVNGNCPPYEHYHCGNVVAINNQTNGKNFTYVNNGGSPGWASIGTDTLVATQQAYASFTAAGYDTTTILFTNAIGSFPKYIPLGNSPVRNQGQNVSALFNTDIYGVKRSGIAGQTWDPGATQNNGNNFTYSVSGSVNTSAGAYNAAGQLIRTIWSLKPETNGGKTGFWDGNDDFGNVAIGGPFTIKVLSSNVNYNWDGVIGNSSTVQTGPHTLGGLFGDPGAFYGAVASGSNIYFVSGYPELGTSEWKTTAANINYRIGFVGPNMASNLEFLATDGTNMYIAGFDAGSNTHTFVYAHTVPGEVAVTFSSGTNYTPVNGTTQSMIAYLGSGALTSNEITGLAVQQTHNFLFVVRTGLNQVLVLNKTTGAIVQTITITGAGRCAVDGLDDVWIADATNIKQYSVNSGTGALTATGITIALTNVGGLAVSPNGTKIAAIDVTNELVKQYKTSDGSFFNSLGTGVSYQTNPVVLNNKFYWSDTTGTVFLSAFVTYLPDSSILVGDRANGRTQHFASDFSTFIESQTYTSRDYNAAVDNNNSQRLFMNGLEYAIDYTKPIGQCWTLVNNWNGKIFSANYSNSFTPVTINQGAFANGRTYIMLRGPGFTFYPYELVPGFGLRLAGTGRNFANGYAIEPSTGDLIAPTGGSTFTYRRYALTGFDGSNNPVWSGSFTGTSITLGATDPQQTNGYNSNVLKTSLGNFISFAQQPLSTITKHLGSIPEGSSIWRWESLIGTSQSTYTGPFPQQGQSPYLIAFDNGNSVVNAGGVFAINGTHVIMGYHGEFWKSAQTNYYWDIDDSTGLPAAMFGKSWVDYPTYGSASKFTNYAPAQVTGNALNGTAIVGTDGKLYLYQSEEVIHDGIQRWSETGTVSHQTATYPVVGPGPTLSGIDILSGLSRGTTNFPSGTGGWTRSTADFSSGGSHLTSTTGAKSYDLTHSTDLYVTQQTNVVTDVSFTHQLIAAGQKSNSWQMTFDAIWEGNITNTVQSPPYAGGSYIELLDSAGKIIAEVHMDGSGGSFEHIVMNGIAVMTDSTLLSVYRTYVRLKPTNLDVPTVLFTYVNGNLTLTYQTVNGPASTTVTTPLQAGAVMTQPYTLKLHFFETTTGAYDILGKAIGIQNAYFNQNYVPSSPSCNCHIRTRGKFTQVISH